MTRGIKLKQLRNKKNLSQVNAARSIGVSKQTLFKYENDIVTNIPTDVIERIAKVYDTTPAYIMGWTNSENADDDDTRNKEFIELFEHAAPIVQESVVNILKSAQPKS